MKNIIKIILFAVVVLFVPAIAFAQGSGSIEPTPRTPPGEGIRDESNFVVTHSATGTIVGLKEGILIIKTEKNKEVRVGLLNSTKYKLGKKKLDASELSDDLFKEGRQVKITYAPFADKKFPVDKVALEVRFIEAKEAKEKPKFG